MNATAGNAGATTDSLAYSSVQTSALTAMDVDTLTPRKKVVAWRRRTSYYSHVPDKEGNRLGRLKSQKRTDRAMRFFFVRMPLSASYERRWRGSRKACWFSFVHQSSNPATCRPPRLDAGRGLTAQKEAPMPIATHTPEQSRSEIISRLAGNANVVAAMLFVANLLEQDAQQSALLTCSSIADDVARDLDALAGGVV